MELQCTFDNSEWSLGDKRMVRYTCTIEKASITKVGTEISAVIGEHLLGRSNKDVTAIMINHSIVHYFPQGLLKIFLNLDSLQIGKCELKEISRKDLIGFEKLEDLSLPKNELRLLPSDLFEEMVNLREISLYGNKLQFLSSELLDPIADNKITNLDFRKNTKINAFYLPGANESVKSMQELMKIIDDNCEPLKDEKEDFAGSFVVGFKELWTSKDFSDFIVIGGVDGSSKEFAVHKCVLGTQSSVMYATLKNDMKEAQTGRMKIDDFSADVVEGMLHFMYTGEVKNETFAMDLYAIAIKYDLKNLKFVTEKIILRNIDDSNAIEIFGFGHLQIADKIKRRAFNKIKKMFPDFDFNNEAMENPGKLKNLIDIHRELMKVQAEMSSALKLVTN
jgi:BTB/POZ domain/Leucine rich repeat